MCGKEGVELGHTVHGNQANLTTCNVIAYSHKVALVIGINSITMQVEVQEITKMYHHCIDSFLDYLNDIFVSHYVGHPNPLGIKLSALAPHQGVPSIVGKGPEIENGHCLLFQG